MPGGGQDRRVDLVSRGFAAIIGFAFIGIGFAIGLLLGYHGLVLIPIALAIGLVAGAIVFFVSRGIAHGAGRGLGAFIAPSGATTPYQQTYSRAQALAAAGDIAGAIREYDAHLSEQPFDITLHVQAAELHARDGDTERAATLFREARRLAESRGDREREMYATQRLADLALGRGDDPGRALVELRRLVDRFPGTREAEGARVAIARLKGKPR